MKLDLDFLWAPTIWAHKFRLNTNWSDAGLPLVRPFLSSTPFPTTRGLDN